jgi:hypothetical protein
MDGIESTKEIAVSWVEADGWLFEAVPGTPYIIGTPEPERGVWVMGVDPDECRREWERLAPTWWGYRPSSGSERRN